MATPLCMTKIQMDQLLKADPFGIPKFCRAISSEEQAFAFSVHTGLVNMQNPLCPCGQTIFDQARSSGQWYLHCRPRVGVLEKGRCSVVSSLSQHTYESLVSRDPNRNALCPGTNRSLVLSGISYVSCRPNWRL